MERQRQVDECGKKEREDSPSGGNTQIYKDKETRTKQDCVSNYAYVCSQVEVHNHVLPLTSTRGRYPPALELLTPKHSVL